MHSRSRSMYANFDKNWKKCQNRQASVWINIPAIPKHTLFPTLKLLSLTHNPMITFCVNCMKKYIHALFLFFGNLKILGLSFHREYI